MVEQQSCPYRSSNHTTGSSLRIVIALWSTGTGCAADSSWSRPCSILCSCRRKSQPNSHVTWPFDICFCMVRWYKHSTQHVRYDCSVYIIWWMSGLKELAATEMCVCFFPCLFFFFRFPSIFTRVTRGIVFFFPILFPFLFLYPDLEQRISSQEKGSCARDRFQVQKLTVFHFLHW